MLVVPHRLRAGPRPTEILQKACPAGHRSPPYRYNRIMSGGRSSERKHIRRLEKIHQNIKPKIYFITVCASRRRKVLADDTLYEALVDALRKAASKTGWLVGRYVVMPDHVHFFCTPASGEAELSKFIALWKSQTTRKAWDAGIKGSLWQKEYFDHLLRSDESYKKKWEYVRHNPVRHGLCKSPDDWPYQGEIHLP
jgi:putative transposase